MKNIINYIFIGFVQGLTEFLPISSSGHIVLFGSLFELDNLLLLSVVAHVGTLFAVIWCYKNKLKQLIKQPFCKTNFNLVFATIPTVICVVIFNSFLEENFATSTLIWGFLISSILLVVADLKQDGKKQMTFKNSLVMGVGQGLALLPGISRSGTTLCFGLLCGVNKNEALDFSFLMSIPVIIGSAIFETLKLFTCQLTVNWIGIFCVLISSFIFGIISIKLMLKIIKSNKLYFFAIYLIVLSLIILLLF